jgi:hypothetical protein
MNINTSASVIINRPREDVFALATDHAVIPELFRGFGPIPAIEKISMIEGSGLTAGSVRLVENSDGSKLRERIVLFNPPREQQYILESGFRPPFSLLVSSGQGHWTFNRSSNGTLVTWNFSFTLTHPLAYPMAMQVATVLFNQAQKQCLKRLKNKCEQQAS